MKRFFPNDLRQWTRGTWARIPCEPIVNFCFDTRKLGENECFLAIKKKHNDGHHYAKMAEQQRAIAAIVEHEIEDCSLPQLVVENTLKAFQTIAKNYRKTLPTFTITLTGSCGKTTAKELLALLLGPQTFKTPENFNNYLGVPYALTHIDPQIHPQAVLEVGINMPNEMETLADIIQPDDALLLNIEPVHLGNFKDLNSIFFEKVSLFKHAKKNVFLPKKWKSLYNSSSPCYYFTTDPKDTSAYAISYALKFTDLGWEIQVKNHIFNVPFKIGSKTAETFAMVIGVVLQKGISSEKIQSRLLQWKPAPLRGVWKHIKGKDYFVDCYNANPAAFEDSLQHFYREKPTNKPVAYIIGSMAELEPHGEALHKKIVPYFRLSSADVVICIGDFSQTLADEFLQKKIALPAQFYTFKTTAEAQTFIQNLPQSCFYLKGSHCYHLENLVAED